ncbi:unnamed protein product [Urochloa humidicola]
MSFDAKLILAALDKHFDAVDAMWDRLFAAQDARWAKQDAMREASKGVPAPTQYAAVGADAVAGYRGDLFDGGDVPDEHHFKEPIVANNWGGLFEQPAHMLEERDLASSDEFRNFTDPDVPACITPALCQCPRAAFPPLMRTTPPAPRSQGA